MWLGYTISFVCGLLAACAGLILIFRNFMRMTCTQYQKYEERLSEKRELLRLQSLEIEKRTLAVRQLIHRINHDGARPKSASIVGLCNISDKEFGNLKVLTKDIDDILVLMERPNHHQWALIAKDKFASVKIRVSLLNDYVNRMRITAQGLLDYTKDSFKEFENLQ